MVWEAGRDLRHGGKARPCGQAAEPRRLVEEGIRPGCVKEKSWTPGDRRVGGSLGSGPALGSGETRDQLAGGVPKTSHVCQPSCFTLR